MHMTLALPVQIFIGQFQVVFPDQLGEDQVQLHIRETISQLAFFFKPDSLCLLLPQATPCAQRERLAGFLDICRVWIQPSLRLKLHWLSKVLLIMSYCICAGVDLGLYPIPLVGLWCKRGRYHARLGGPNGRPLSFQEICEGSLEGPVGTSVDLH